MEPERTLMLPLACVHACLRLLVCGAGRARWRDEGRSEERSGERREESPEEVEECKEKVNKGTVSKTLPTFKRVTCVCACVCARVRVRVCVCVW